MSKNTLVEDKELDLIAASEVRNADGSRRYQSLQTLRRRVQSGALYSEIRGGKHFVKVSELEAKMAQRPETVEEWAHRMASAAPPMTDAQAARVVAILRGGASG